MSRKFWILILIIFYDYEDFMKTSECYEKKIYSNKMKQKVVGFNSKNLREMKAIKEEHI